MPDEPPTNVVCILTDDQGPWALGCAGNDEIRTPNLDRLAAEGMRFENHFCTSPVCSPARASLLTGRIPSAHGVHDWICARSLPPRPVQYLQDQPAYTDVLAAAGYAVGLSGKWHLGDCRRPQHGYTHWLTLPGGGAPYNDPELVHDGRLVRHEGYQTDLLFDDALAFLDAHRGRPFYLDVHTFAPHAPWDDQPDELTALYKDCPFRTCPQEWPHPDTRPSVRGWHGVRENLEGYFAAVTGVDRGVGRLLAKLDELGLRQSTLVIFLSDNGFSCGQRGLWGKGNGTFPLNMFENSVKVPSIWSQPGRIPAGRVTDAMVSHYDVAPTLLDYLHLEAPEDPLAPGRSFLPVLTGRTDQAHENVFACAEYGPVRMVRTAAWKYVHRYPYGPHELYDLSADPQERTNLVDEKGQRRRVAEMRRRLRDWFARHADPRLDGARWPVTGHGQRERIDARHAGTDAFQPLR